jgi:UDP-N-acetylglucosamine 4,6-dehydratase
MHGGEIFVPKIPSMRIVDLARAMAPDKPHKIVGVRPGEKLHEIMVTEDDARNTIELGDRYVINPAFALWHDSTQPGIIGPAVAERFAYASNTNDEWLGEVEFKQMLRGSEHAR